MNITISHSAREIPPTVSYAEMSIAIILEALATGRAPLMPKCLFIAQAQALLSPEGDALFETLNTLGREDFL
jgi:hypothetical protein